MGESERNFLKLDVVFDPVTPGKGIFKLIFFNFMVNCPAIYFNEYIELKFLKIGPAKPEISCRPVKKR